MADSPGAADRFVELPPLPPPPPPHPISAAVDAKNNGTRDLRCFICSACDPDVNVSGCLNLNRIRPEWHSINESTDPRREFADQVGLLGTVRLGRPGGDRYQLVSPLDKRLRTLDVGAQRKLATAYATI